MRNLSIALLIVTALCLTAIVALATPPPDDAEAVVTVTVEIIGEWAGDFNTIALANITAQGSEPNGSQATTLYTNGDVDITADNVGTEAQLKKVGDANQTLVTSYMLTDDGGDATGNTGGTDETEYTTYDDFLHDTPFAITHVAGDGDVVITLHAKAANPPGEVADAGNYSATQTLTATW